MREQKNSSQAHSQYDLVIRPTHIADDGISIDYRVGDVALTVQVRIGDITPILTRLSTDYMRRLYRFGPLQETEIDHVAETASALLLPSSVRSLLRNGEVRRIQVVANYDDPCLPWELLHDGLGFVATRIPIITTPAGLENEEVVSQAPEALLVVDGIPGGDSLGTFQEEHFSHIDFGRGKVTRVLARSKEDLLVATRRAPHDVLHFISHTFVHNDGGIRFLLGNDSIAVQDVILAATQVPDTIFLSACQTAQGGKDYSYRQNAAFLLSAALGVHVIGTVGWLDWATSEQFEREFYNNFASFGDIEIAMTATRSDLYRDHTLDWWACSLVGPRTKLASKVDQMP